MNHKSMNFENYLPNTSSQQDLSFPPVLNAGVLLLTICCRLRLAGKNSNGNAHKTAATPNARKPSHQAPSQRGSCGCKSTSVEKSKETSDLM